MALTAGSRIGNFEVLEPLGAGGMGEVHRARDVRLDRIVAIKSLPAAFVNDAARRARFEREARLLAALAHPHIAGIHGIEDAEGATYLVLEFVDGETLERRLARGPLRLREALEVAVQIASAIEAAHERGIVHRDLKPANVVITPDRGAKVLDFGLAKGDDDGAGPPQNLSASPTVAIGHTTAGLVLGTAPYMSPEQARGRPVDRATDVWSFGCVLFEVLSGRRPFGGDTVPDVIAHVIERDPDWEALPVAVPPRVRDLIARCLIKDAARRPSDIGALGRELGEIAREHRPGGGRDDGRSVSPAPSLAVLYFENLAQDSESDYFCAGITEDILTDLSKIKGLRVASRNAVARYRGAPVDIAQVGAELGVAAVLEGSVRRHGDRVRITAQLIGAADGFHLWAERYDRTLQDVFAVQEEIASSIANALQIALTPSDVRHIGHGRPSDARAYDLYLKGREHYRRYTIEEMLRAFDLFQEASKVDPGYALAWAGMADCYGKLCEFGGGGTDIDLLIRLGTEAGRRAVELDPRLPEAHKALAMMIEVAGDYPGARTALKRAIDLDPRFVPAIVNLGILDFAFADIAATERAMRRAIECDPQDPHAPGWLALLLLYTGRYEEALARTRMARTLSDTPFYVTFVHTTRIMVHLWRNDLDAAQAALEEARRDSTDPANLSAAEALIDARSGRIEEARRAVAELASAPDLGSPSLEMLADTALRCGDPAAVRFLQRRLMDLIAPTLVRLNWELHSLVDAFPAPSGSGTHALVWPLEAPMMNPRVFSQFAEVRVASGRPLASDVASAASPSSSS